MKLQSEIANTFFENDYVKIALDKNIVTGTFKSEFIDLSLAQMIIKWRLEFQNGNWYPLLSNIKSIKNNTKEARDYMASKEACEGITAAAILIDSPVGKTIGNFLIFCSKPVVPSKIFTDEAESIQWLQQYTEV